MGKKTKLDWKEDSSCSEHAHCLWWLTFQLKFLKQKNLVSLPCFLLGGFSFLCCPAALVALCLLFFPLCLFAFACGFVLSLFLVSWLHLLHSLHVIMLSLLTLPFSCPAFRLVLCTISGFNSVSLFSWSNACPLFYSFLVQNSCILSLENGDSRSLFFIISLPNNLHQHFQNQQCNLGAPAGCTVMGKYSTMVRQAGLKGPRLLIFALTFEV